MPEPDLHPYLCLLADSLLTVLADGGEPALVRVISDSEGAEVGLLPLDGMSPAEYLLGTVAPAEWTALGVATRGRAGPLAGHGPSSTAEVIVLVPRAGEVIGRMRHGDEIFTEPPAYGLTVDCLQRALGLPTAPPQVPATHVLALVWLHAIIKGGPGGAENALDVLLLAHEAPLEWERLHQFVIDGRWPEPTLTPEDAAWLDAGAFSRWMLDGRPSLTAMLAEVARVVGFGEARQCAGLLQEIGLDVAPSTLPNRKERRRRRAC